MKHVNAKIVAIAAASFAALSIALLWAWNALAELSGGPTAEYRHVIAALVIAITARALVTTRRRHHATRAR